MTAEAEYGNMLLRRYFPREDKTVQIGGSGELSSEGAYITKLKQNPLCQHQNTQCSPSFRQLPKQVKMAAAGQSEQKMLQNVYACARVLWPPPTPFAKARLLHNTQ